MTATERSKQWRLEHGERYREALRAWRAKNPQYMRDYRRKNRSKIAEQMTQWREENAVHVKKYNDNARVVKRDERAKQFKSWRLRNLDKRNQTEALRRARRRSATIGDLTDIAKVYERAKWWAKWFTVEVDHVISLAKGGTHEAKNLQIIYDYENRRKGVNPGYKPRVVFV